MRLVVALPWPTGLTPNEREPDWRKRKLAADHRETARLLTRSAIATEVKAGRPGYFPSHGDLTIHFTAFPKPRGKVGDDDNLIAGMKFARDGIAEALRTDDKRFRTQPVTWGPRSAMGAVLVTLETPT